MPIARIGFNGAQPASERKPGDDDDRSEWQPLITFAAAAEESTCAAGAALWRVASIMEAAD